MFCAALLALALTADPKPRLDADGIPLPIEALRRFGSARFCSDMPRAVAFSPDEKMAYMVLTGTPQWSADNPALVSAWEMPSGRPLWTFTDKKVTGHRVAADPDGKVVWVVGLTGDVSEYDPGKVSVVRVKLDAATGKELDRVTPGTVLTDALDLRPNGTLVWNRVKDNDLTVRLLGPDGSSDRMLWESEEFGPDRMKFSPDGKVLFVGGRVAADFGYKLAAVEVATGKTKWTISTPMQDTLAVSPDGKMVVASVSGDPPPKPPAKPPEHRYERPTLTAITAWATDTGDHLGGLLVGDRALQIYRYNTPNTGRPMVFSPDAKTFRTLDDNWKGLGIDVGTWRVDKDAAGPPGAAFGWYTPDGKTYLAPDGSRNLTVYDATTHKPINPPPGLLRGERRYRLEDVGGMAFSADGRRIQHKTIGYVWVEWEADTGKEVARVSWEKRRDEPREGVMSVGWEPRYTLRSPDGKLLFRRTGQRLQDAERLANAELLDAASGKQVAEVAVKGSGAFAFTPDSKRIIGVVGLPGKLRVWNATTGHEVATVAGPQNDNGNRDFLRIHPSQNWCAIAEEVRVGGRSRGTTWQVSRFDLDPLKRIKSWTGPGVIETFDLSAGGRIVGWVSPRDSVTFDKVALVVLEIDADDPRLISLPTKPTAFAVSPDGCMAAVGIGSGGIELYELATGKKRHTFTGLKRSVTSLAFNPDGKTLASESADGPVILWDVRGDLTKPAKPDVAGWDTAWKALIGDDAEKAFAAVRLIAAYPDEGAAELKKRFAEVKAPTAVSAERAVEALRLADTESARKQIAEWAKGPDKDPLTVAAKRK